MISAISFVPRGAAKALPVRYQMTEEEAAMMAEAKGGRGGMEMVGMDDDGEDGGRGAPEDQLDSEEDMEGKDGQHGLPDDLNMDDYDDQEQGTGLVGIGETEPDRGGNMGQGDGLPDDADTDSDAEDDVPLRDSDAIILVAQTEEDYR